MTPWLAGLAACTVMVAVAYGLARLVAWAGHALLDHWDTDEDEIEAAMRRHPAGKQRDAK